jgi:hypothetical protein
MIKLICFSRVKRITEYSIVTEGLSNSNPMYRLYLMESFWIWDPNFAIKFHNHFEVQGFHQADKKT